MQSLLLYKSDYVLYLCAMKQENLFMPFEVRMRHYDRFPTAEHQHSFFELCYIASGSGEFVSGRRRCNFGRGSVFFVRPYTNHTYRLDGMCDIIYVQLSDQYIVRALSAAEKESLEACPSPDMSALVSPADARRLALVMECLGSECTAPSYGTQRIASCLIDSVLAICARSARQVAGEALRQADSESKMMAMLQFIRLHLDNPDMLRAASLGSRFNLAASYIGKFFKAHTGESLSRYVAQCRVRAVEELLAHTDLRVGEITLKTGFTDDSHLTHTFKRATGLTPMEYRRRLYASPAAGGGAGDGGGGPAGQR